MRSAKKCSTVQISVGPSWRDPERLCGKREIRVESWGLSRASHCVDGGGRYRKGVLRGRGPDVGKLGPF